jgi:hypothetical protein
MDACVSAIEPSPYMVDASKKRIGVEFIKTSAIGRIG